MFICSVHKLSPLDIFPSSLLPLFQNESKCQTFHMKMSSAYSFIFMQINVIFIKMVSHLDSLWHRGTRELGNGLLVYHNAWWFHARNISNVFFLFLLRYHNLFTLLTEWFLNLCFIAWQWKRSLIVLFLITQSSKFARGNCALFLKIEKVVPVLCNKS